MSDEQLAYWKELAQAVDGAPVDYDVHAATRKELPRIVTALAAATQRAEAAEAVAGNMLNHLLPDTIRAIVLDLSAAERHAPDMGEFAITPQTLEFRDKCAAFLGAEWPDSAWDEEWLTALDAERARVAELEAHLAARQRRAELDAGGIGAVCPACGYELDEHGWCGMCTPEAVQP